MSKMLKAAVEILKEEYIPQASQPNIFVPEESYRNILPLLDVWGESSKSQDALDKAKYIHQKLLDINPDRPVDALITTLVNLGAVKFGETKIDKVYKFFHLIEESRKALRHHKLISDEITGLISGGEK